MFIFAAEHVDMLENCFVQILTIRLYIGGNFRSNWKIFSSAREHEASNL